MIKETVNAIMLILSFTPNLKGFLCPENWYWKETKTLCRAINGHIEKRGNNVLVCCGD